MKIAFKPRVWTDHRLIKKQLNELHFGLVSYSKDCIADCDILITSKLPTESGWLCYKDVEPNKENALILDFGENILNHGAIDEIVERQLAMGAKKKGKKGQAVMKRCIHCDLMVYASTMKCPECGNYFPINTMPKIQQEASRLAILSSERESLKEWMNVSKVTYRRHTKISNKSTTMKVTYHVGNMLSFNEYVCLDHEGGAKTRAQSWWIERHGGSLFRPSVDEALEFLKESSIREPSQIELITGGKYPEITGFRFS